MEDKNQNENTKNALCYIPIVAFVLLFVENNKSAALKKHIKYAIFLFFGHMIIQFILWAWFGSIFAFVYLCISIFLAYKAYNGEEVQLDQIDELESKIKDNFK